MLASGGRAHEDSSLQTNAVQNSWRVIILSPRSGSATKAVRQISMRVPNRRFSRELYLLRQRIAVVD